MSYIEINIKNVICASEHIAAARKEAFSARMGIRGTVRFIDSQIRSCNNLDSRLNQICEHICRIENEMQKIDSVVSDGANRYRMVELQARQGVEELSEIKIQNRVMENIGRNRERYFL